MILSKQGNIFLEDVDALVNPVNCVGVMGRGLALQFRHKFPENYTAYAAACRNQLVVPGKVFVHKTGRLLPPRLILNFPTKRHWRTQSRLEDIAAGLDDLIRVIRDEHIASLALPPLGCGLGGLSWPLVRHLVAERLAPLQDVRIVLFEPAPG